MNASEYVRSPGEVLPAMVVAFDSGDLDQVDELVHGEYLDHQGLPHIRPIRGAGGFRQVVEAARSGYEDLSVEIADLIEGVDRAAGRLVWSGVRRTGEASQHETLDIVRVDTGRSIEHWGGHSSLSPRSPIRRCGTASRAFDGVEGRGRRPLRAG